MISVVPAENSGAAKAGATAIQFVAKKAAAKRDAAAFFSTFTPFKAVGEREPSHLLRDAGAKALTLALKVRSRDRKKVFMVHKRRMEKTLLMILMICR
mmetsp:Transcript_10250/g.14711  ORF Transcript_10250/g.14711 Transcript_10250/m.14711 type:complete len:98 (+) Transcript_10250:459-752(+)